MTQPEPLDLTRHRHVFDPTKFEGRIDVIGVGATGSKIAVSLARLGLARPGVLHVWDGDIIEPHNIPNQAYFPRQVNQLKSEAALELIEELGGDVHRHGAWSPEQYRNIGDIVFCMVDSMEVRRQIFDAFKRSSRVRLVIDSRMGTDQGQLLTWSPNHAPSMNQYEGTLFGDDDAHVERSECGGTLSVGPTSDIISGLAVWAFMRFVNDEPIENEIVFGARTPALNVID